MPRVLIIALIVIMSVYAFADDPGSPDSLIIGQVTIEPGVPSIMLPIYVRTDDPVSEIILPLEWASFDGMIHPAGVYYFNTLLSWDECLDTVILDQDHLLVRCTSDNGGEPNPVLNTNNQRELAFLVRIVFREGAGEQYMPIYTYVDDNFGAARFELSDGNTSFSPRVVPGGVDYAMVDVDEITSLPDKVELGQNYPNPFNMKTEIKLSIPNKSYVNLNVFDILGRQIKVLLSDNLEAGNYNIIWDGRNESGEEVSTGMYFYNLKTSDVSLTKKMILIK